MKLLKKTLVAAGVATAVLATGAAQAATISNPSTAAVPAAGKTIVNESVRTVISPAVTVVTLGATEALSVDDSVTFTLSSGTWAAIASGDLTPSTGTIALVSGGAGTSAAVFRVTGAIAGASTLTLAATATITGTAIPDGTTVNIQADMNGFVGGTSQALFGSPLTSLNTAMAPAMTVALVANTAGIFDVATGFTSLTAGSGASANTSGNATITPTINPAAVVNQTTVGAPLTAPTNNKTLITIAGPMAGLTSIGSANIQGSSAAGVATANTTTTFTMDTATNMAWGTTDDNTAVTTISMVFAGTMAYDASAYTATVSLLSDTAGGYSANASVGTGSLFSFSRNGTSFATNSFGSLNKLTVTDRSGGLGGTGADGAIALTAYGADGAAVTCTGLTIANLPNNGTSTIQGADVMAACAGAKRIEGIVNSTSILVTNTKVAADGATSQSGLGTGNNTVAN